MVIVDMGTEMYDASDFNMRMYYASLAFNPFHSGYLQTGGMYTQTVKYPVEMQHNAEFHQDLDCLLR